MENNTKKEIYFYPDVILNIAIVMFILFALLLGLSVFSPAELPEEANPLIKPLEIKPEWYLLFLYKFYNILPVKILFIKRIMLFTIIVGGVFIFFLLVPFVDISKYREPLKRPFFLCVGIFMLLFILIFSVWGFLK